MGIVQETTKRATGVATGAVKGASWAAGQGFGALNRLRGGGGEAEQESQGPSGQRSTAPKDLNDQDLARKVESVIFRGAKAAKIDKGKIDVNAVDGAVWLRGVAPNAAAINSLEAATRAIPEVTEVHNLLHLPKTPAPTRTDTPAGQRKTRRSTTKPATPRTEPRQLNADKTVKRNEDLPDELAKTRKGRQPAKLGSKGKATGSASSAKPTPAQKSERFERTEDSGAPKTPTSSVGTAGGPPAGGGEVT